MTQTNDTQLIDTKINDTKIIDTKINDTILSVVEIIVTETSVMMKVVHSLEYMTLTLPDYQGDRPGLWGHGQKLRRVVAYSQFILRVVSFEGYLINNKNSRKVTTTPPPSRTLIHSQGGQFRGVSYYKERQPQSDHPTSIWDFNSFSGWSVLRCILLIRKTSIK